MPIKKILLVDDSKTELHFLSELLTKRGYSVRTAEDGEDAMRRLGEDKPDLILMDIQLPEISGLEVTKWLKEDDELKAIPVIAVTADYQGRPAGRVTLTPLVFNDAQSIIFLVAGSNKADAQRMKTGFMFGVA